MPNKSREQILIVDDDRASRNLLVRTLLNAGYRCRESSDGADALRVLRAEPPSVLLLDFDMPGLNGAEVLKELRGDSNPEIAQLPTIMLTGHGGENSEVLCLEAGADDFVTKPIKPAVLQARIATQLRLCSMRRQLQQQNDVLEAWRRDLEQDLEAARLTQQSLIPQASPQFAGWDVAACYQPVIQVGGDMYGWLRMNDGCTLFWIADATGHGASAALLTTLAKLLFHHGSAESNQPAEIIKAVNDDFRGIFGARFFMTAMCVALDLESGRATVVGAGHPPLLVSRASGVTESFRSSAPPLGLIEQDVTQDVIDLNPGDTFLLYTDGLYGAADAKKQRFTPEHLAALLQPNVNSAQAFLDSILERVASHQDARPLPDDVAAVVVRRAK